MSETSETANECMAGLLDALGWRFARDGDKAQPFHQVFSVLGVSADLSRVANGEVTLRNKDARA